MPAPQILFFFPENPFSNRAGNTTRAKSNLTLLKQIGCNIDLVSCKNLCEDMGDNFDYNPSLVDNYFLIEKKPIKSFTSLSYWRYKWLKLISKKNRYNSYLTLYAKKGFESILSSKKYDFIVINYETWSGLIDHRLCENTIKIVDTHDWMTLNEFYKNPAIDIGYRFNEEIKNLNKFDKVITISQDEKFVFTGFLGEKVINVPPSFATNYSPQTSKKWDLIFVGSENIFNIKSLEWFFEKVYPFLKNSIRILVVGRVSKYISVPKSVETIPFAESLSDYYTQSKVALCPMLAGTGVKIKVIEALSFGLPVVGTIRSIDGFSSKTDNGCLIADDPEDFKTQVISLLEDENYYKKIKAQAVEYFASNFSENSGLTKWRQILNS